MQITKKKINASLLDQIIIKEYRVISAIEEAIANNKKLLLTYFNQHSFNKVYEETQYRELLSNEFQLYMDGFGMYLALRYVFNKAPELFNATDFNGHLLDKFVKGGIKYFFIGGDIKNENITVAMGKRTSFCGYHPGYNISHTILKEKIIEVNPQVIMIGMGIPLQEELAYKLSRSFNDKVVICVGNFFEFYFKQQKRVPKIFRNKGIEWIYRLVLEPSRLWKRYILGIPLFVFRVLLLKSE